MGREALHRLDPGGPVRQDAAVAEHAGRVPEEDLMRALYREHSGALFAYVLRLVGGDRYLAEDIVQETLLRAWKSASRLDPAARSLRPWLVTVARRLVIDGHRSRLARPPEASPAALDQLPAEDELDRSLRLMTISDALEDLTDAHRQVLIETYFKGRTVNEAAAELGVPPGTVRSRVFYALRSLKIALEERGVTTS
jgi:RNA polymerase sigma-70 factor (ECF subfamily)